MTTATCPLIPVFENGQPVLRREAIARPDRMIEHLAGLDPVQSALDQVAHCLGTDVVSEVIGRARRIVRRPGRNDVDRLVVENRPGSARQTHPKRGRGQVARLKLSKVAEDLAPCRFSGSRALQTTRMTCFPRRPPISIARWASAISDIG
ncbi:hypothetical protein [Lichenihabitans psoromatis]|uniref:hypothetical protein n=1 Tax=Lichenihabitans psoromatis TaxID=2528642 RepID=UPI00103609B2